MSWAKIARAFERGISPPARNKRPNKAISRPREITCEGETKRLVDWVNDERNTQYLAMSTLAKRADNPDNLVSITVWMRPTRAGRKA